MLYFDKQWKGGTNLLKRINTCFEGKKCAQCGRKTWNQNKYTKNNKKLRKCSQCLMMLYCSHDCQKKHWKSVHNKECYLFYNQKISIQRTGNPEQYHIVIEYKD